MKRRASLFTFSVLVLTSLFSLGFRDCGQADLVEWIARVLSDHEERISDLEDCQCDGVLAPVCGTDGRTYVNRCEARCAGVRVVAVGQCQEPECGGSEELACEEGDFCELPAGCHPMAGGVCEEQPAACTREYVPVCGCDEVTYGNDCERRAAGVPLAHRGECRTPPERCDTNDACGEDEFCQRAPGVCESRPGVCRPLPEACTQQYDPVCGCDGETYGNRCEAAAAGVSVDHERACRDPEKPICHIPPGNPYNRHTLWVDESAIGAHIGHGDHRGHCEDHRDD